MEYLNLTDSERIELCMEYMANGLEIPQEIKEWLKVNGLLYLVEVTQLA